MKGTISLPSVLRWTVFGIITSPFWIILIVSGAIMWVGFWIARKDLRDYVHFQL
jgi:hypothetical protein